LTRPKFTTSQPLPLFPNVVKSPLGDKTTLCLPSLRQAVRHATTTIIISEQLNEGEHMTERMWADLARYYDDIYAWKDYASEATRITEVVERRCTSGGNALLDVACGTGEHIKYLQDRFIITGADLNPAMLEVARQKFPNTSFIEADMVTMNLHHQFDVVVCLFSSIGYVKTYDNLQRTLAAFYAHLKPGGVTIIEPFVKPDKYKVGMPHALTVDKPDLKISRMNVSEREEDLAIMDFYFQIATPQGVQQFRDRHELGLFEVERFKHTMTEVGFADVEFLSDGLMKDRGLYVGNRGKS
jgi:ubiquinone/menaquinone biosynthesis C-methylase UbiE